VAPLRATYRLQLGPGLDFHDAHALVPYLHDLGVSHLYLSPCFQARAGSTHGYDVTDPGRISEELGGEAAFRELAGAGLGVILDIVPNHMAADDANRYWADPGLRERFFDIDPVSGRHRRFFDIDHLAGVRQEDPEVFAATHELALRLVGEGAVDGLRIDHPDGLADPAGYLRRLRAAGVERVWVEKILDPGEPLRDWPVEGTVGYEFLNDAAALFVDPAGEDDLTALHPEPFAPERAKLEQLRGTFAPEVERLRRLHDDPSLDEALAGLPVYRTYIPPVEEADREALSGNPLRELLLGGDAPAEFVARFQQTTPAVMAKGVEDTEFYRYVRLLALNEVGGDPTRFGISVERFHEGCIERARRFPRGLLITQTHDTKRSGDSRARIGALAGMAGEWRALVEGWRGLVPDGGPPSRAEAYLILQTMVGAWPLELERLEAYVEKALREAKVNTNWVEPDAVYERGVRDWCRALYGNRAFLDELEPFVERVARAGERSALGQTLLKLTAPGVPDVYQGDELWRLSLVDPDNRRPVDWEERREALAAVRAGTAPERATVKLFLIHRALELRARRPDAFAGDHAPVEAGGGCCAYVRGGDVLAATAVREAASDPRVEVPPGAWRNVLTGAPHDVRGPLPLSEIALGEWPLALLERVAR
jgi:(1->4)-alpha-D-glucan 1-alpha-D-glucosylmutase